MKDPRASFTVAHKDFKVRQSDTAHVISSYVLSRP